MIQIRTKRLWLEACSLENAKALVFQQFESLPFIIPKNWPSDEVKSLLPYYIERLEQDSQMLGWGLWLIIKRDDHQIIGSGVVKSVENNGVREIGYEIVSSYQKQGFGYEAVAAIVKWVFSHERITTIIAACDESNIRSKRLLEKLGMCCIKKEPPFLLWELSKAAD